MPYTNLRPIPGWEGLYSVTDDGRVWSHDRTINHWRGKTAHLRGRWLKTADNGHGYLTVKLCQNGKAHTIRLHRLVALAFTPNPLALPEINHIDGNRTNNRATNLEWCDRSHNIRHAMRHGPSSKFLAAKRKPRTQTQRHTAFLSGRRISMLYGAIRMQRRADELAAVNATAKEQGQPALHRQDDRAQRDG